MYIKKVRGSAKQLMRKTAIWNLKGGVGKTTTVMQLAHYQAEEKIYF